MLRDVWTRFGDNNIIAVLRLTCKEWRAELVLIPMTARAGTYTRGKYAAIRARGKVIQYMSPEKTIRMTKLRGVDDQYGDIDGVIWDGPASQVLYCHRAVFGKWPKFTTAIDFRRVYDGPLALEWEVPERDHRPEAGIYAVHYCENAGISARLVQNAAEDYDDNRVYIIDRVIRH